MNSMIRRVLPIAVTLALAMTSLGFSQSATAAPPPPPTAPLPFDPSGSDQDGVKIPNDSNWFYGIDNVSVFPGVPVSTKGAAIVNVDTYAVNDGARGPTFTLKFNLAVTGQEAPYTFKLRCGVARPSLNEYELWLDIGNPADKSGRYGEFSARVTDRHDLAIAPEYIQSGRVEDGKTKSVLLKPYSRTGLPSGIWTASVSSSSNRNTVLYRKSLELPGCAAVGLSLDNPRVTPTTQAFSMKVTTNKLTRKVSRPKAFAVISHQAGIQWKRWGTKRWFNAGERAAGKNTVLLPRVKALRLRANIKAFQFRAFPADDSIKRPVYSQKLVFEKPPQNRRSFNRWLRR